MLVDVHDNDRLPKPQWYRIIRSYIISVIADAVSPNFLIAVRALADFQYLAQAPEISNTFCTKINEAIQEFHRHKNTIISSGAQTGKGGCVISV